MLFFSLQLLTFLHGFSLGYSPPPTPLHRQPSIKLNLSYLQFTFPPLSCLHIGLILQSWKHQSPPATAAAIFNSSTQTDLCTHQWHPNTVGASNQVVKPPWASLDRSKSSCFSAHHSQPITPNPQLFTMCSLACKSAPLPSTKSNHQFINSTFISHLKSNNPISSCN